MGGGGGGTTHHRAGGGSNNNQALPVEFSSRASTPLAEHVVGIASGVGGNDHLLFGNGGGGVGSNAGGGMPLVINGGNQPLPQISHGAGVGNSSGGGGGSGSSGGMGQESGGGFRESPFYVPEILGFGSNSKRGLRP